jgi:F-type H+-transporting ATPase subunit delta
VIADRYAEAIFSVAQQSNVVEQVDTDLQGVVETLKANQELDLLWKHPVVSAEDKKQIVRDLFAGKIHPVTLNLLQLLFDKKRGVLVEQVQSACHDRYTALRRRATVKVTSALPLEAGQADALRAQLADKLAKDVHMETAVDPDLIGGLILQIEDQVIDNSLRGRLKALSHRVN